MSDPAPVIPPAIHPDVRRLIADIQGITYPAPNRDVALTRVLADMDAQAATLTALRAGDPVATRIRSWARTLRATAATRG